MAKVSPFGALSRHLRLGGACARAVFCLLFVDKLFSACCVRLEKGGLCFETLCHRHCRQPTVPTLICAGARRASSPFSSPRHLDSPHTQHTARAGFAFFALPFAKRRARVRECKTCRWWCFTRHRHLCQNRQHRAAAAKQKTTTTHNRSSYQKQLRRLLNQRSASSLSLSASSIFCALLFKKDNRRAGEFHAAPHWLLCP